MVIPGVWERIWMLGGRRRVLEGIKRGEVWQQFLICIHDMCLVQEPGLDVEKGEQPKLSNHVEGANKYVTT
jgi:hypothetical protein